MLATPITLLQYHLNKEFITARLCENKAKLQLQCEGKCQLQKKIEKETENNNSSSEKSNLKVITADYFLDTPEMIFLPTVAVVRKLNGCYKEAYHHQYTHSIFHPPLV